MEQKARVVIERQSARTRRYQANDYHFLIQASRQHQSGSATSVGWHGLA